MVFRTSFVNLLSTVNGTFPIWFWKKCIAGFFWRHVLSCVLATVFFIDILVSFMGVLRDLWYYNEAIFDVCGRSWILNVTICGTNLCLTEMKKRGISWRNTLFFFVKSWAFHRFIYWLLFRNTEGTSQRLRFIKKQQQKKKDCTIQFPKFYLWIPVLKILSGWRIFCWAKE